MKKRVAIYTQDTGNPADTADDQMERIMSAIVGEEAKIVREHTDYRNFPLHRMLGEALQENSPFDEIVVTDLRLLGDSVNQVDGRVKELADKGVTVRVVGERNTK